MQIDRNYLNTLLESDNPADSIFTLSGWWDGRALGDESERKKALSKVEYNVSCFLDYIGEVNNGGHSQYFYNISADMNDVSQALQDLDLNELNALFQKSFKIVDKSLGKIDRRVFLGSATEKDYKLLSQLDNEFYEIDDEYFSVVLKYLQKNRNSILLEESPL